MPRKFGHDTNFIKENKIQDSMFLACNVAQESQTNVWFLDLGYNNHITGNLEMFSSLDESVKFDVTLGNDNKIEVKGKGNVNILSKKGEKKHISDVYFFPNLKHNLLSIGQLFQKGYRVSFKNKVCTILDKLSSSQLISKIQMKNNRMFPLNIKPNLNVKMLKHNLQ